MPEIQPENPSVATRVEFLTETELFHALDPDALEDLARRSEFVQLAGGDVLMRQGETGDSLYVVLEGRLRVSVAESNSTDSNGTHPPLDESTTSAGRRLVAELSRGDVAGEMSLLSREPRVADVIATRDTNLLRLSRSEFEAFSESHPSGLLEFTRLVIQRLRSSVTDAPQTSRIRNLLYVPLVPDPRLSIVAGQLAEALGAVCSTLHLDSAEFDREFGAGSHRMDWEDSRSASAARYLHALERKHRFVLYEADDAASPWTQRGVRQADRVLVAVSADETPDPSRFKDLFCPNGSQFRFQRVELVLVHDADSEATRGTADWLDAIPGLVRHHHVRIGNATDLGRVARLLTNSAVGVVMGGGGARGLAHVGVLRAMEELTIPADILGGASMGSIFAAGSAIGWNAEEIMDRVREVFRPKRALFDVTFPFVSLLSGNKLGRVLDRLFGDRRIEDLWSSFFCVSTSLSEAKLVVHERGLLRDAIRASISIPGIFPPVHLEKKLLVDGGVLNNLPIDVMADLAEGGPVIAVDVSDTDANLFDPKYRDTMSGWGALSRRLNPFGASPQVPTIFDVIMRSTVVGSRKIMQSHLSQGRADLVLKPPVEDYGMLDFQSYDALSELGYTSSLESLSSWERPGLICRID